MKFNISNEINKCTTCGLCLSTCISFSNSLDESMSPRGKIRSVRNVKLKELNNFEKFNNCFYCFKCQKKCYMLIDFFEVFSLTNKASSSLLKNKLIKSIKSINKRNNYISAQIKRLIQQIDNNFKINKNNLDIQNNTIYLIDSMDYKFGKDKIKKLINVKTSEIILMEEGSGVFEYIYGYQKIGEIISKKYLTLLNNKKVILFSLRDYHFLKKISEQTNFNITLIYYYNNLYDISEIFGTPNLDYNNFKIQIIKKIIKSIKLDDIKDISQFNDINNWDLSD